MQHEFSRVPVTALAFFRDGEVVLAGEGSRLRVYDVKDGERLADFPVFESQALHGIIVHHDLQTVLVWGGPKVRPLSITSASNGDIRIASGAVQTVQDWILDAAFAPSIRENPALAALVSAHNSMTVVRTDKSIEAHQELPCLAVDQLIAGSNCILYSAHARWLSDSCCLFASGTAFGDIIVWSASLTQKGGDVYANSQVHYTFFAHEGSVFGVQLSASLKLPGHERETRLLASCSDDRTIKLWDVSDTTNRSPAIAQVQRDTGFGSRPSEAPDAPPLMTKVMGHTSRIWRVRFATDGNSIERKLRILSFGEDASTITWVVNPSPGASSALPFSLDPVDIETVHAGKNIWSVAMDNSSGRIATGGADAAVVLQARSRKASHVAEVDRSLLCLDDDPDNFRAYGFINDDQLLSTTDQGRIVLTCLETCGKANTREISAALPGLRGYSVVDCVHGCGFIAGSDGSVYAYTSCHDRLSKIAHMERKVAALFPYRQGESTNGLLITTVGAGTASVLLLEEDEVQSGDSGAPSKHSMLTLTLSAGFVATSFTSFQDGGKTFGILGSRNGCIAIYNILPDTSANAVSYSNIIMLAHGKEAVTAMKYSASSDSKDSSCLFSTGRDGTIAVHKITPSDTGLDLVLVHQLTLPFGPNIEGFDLTPGGALRVWGFKSKHFVVYDVPSQRDIMTVDCGGAHRNWAFQPTDGGGTFVWTKASRLYRKTQSQPSYELLKPGLHGREIKAAAISLSSPDHDSNRRLILATGAEDTDIRLSILERGTPKCIHTLRKHNTGIQHLAWSEGGEYLFSSGGFEEFYVWNIRAGVPLPGGIGVVCTSRHPRTGQTDLRITHFDVRSDAGGLACFTIAMAYSDSTLKVWKHIPSGGSATWTLVANGDYTTACLTQTIALALPDSDTVFGDEPRPVFLTASTDGHLTLWHHDHSPTRLSWPQRHRIHPSAILAVALAPHAGAHLLATGGDDNAIALTLLAADGATAETLLLPSAHAAAVTGVQFLPRPSSLPSAVAGGGGEDGTGTADGNTAVPFLVSVGLDQRVKLWEVQVRGPAKLASAAGAGLHVRLARSWVTDVADASSLATYQVGLERGRRDGEDADASEDVVVLVCGVGVEAWRGVFPACSDVRSARMENG